MGFEASDFKMISWNHMQDLDLTASDMLKTSMNIRDLAALKLEPYQLNELGFTWSDFVSMGGNAYSCVADLMTSHRKSDGVADIYAEMATKFESLVRLLNEVSTESYSTGRDLVNLYDRWLRTGSPKAHKVLLEQGMITSFLSPDGDD